jgi:hypothetical protein
MKITYLLPLIVAVLSSQTMLAARHMGENPPADKDAQPAGRPAPMPKALTHAEKLALVEKSRLAPIEREVKGGPFEVGYLARYSRMAKLLGVAGGKEISEQLGLMEKKLGLETRPGEGSLARIKKVEEAYETDTIAERFEKEYGIPARMSQLERIEKLEKYFDSLAMMAMSQRQGRGDDERMKLLQKEFPAVAGELGRIQTVLPKFEKEFGTKAEKDGMPLGFSERLAQVEAAAARKVMSIREEAREMLTEEQRIDDLFNSISM